LETRTRIATYPKYGRVCCFKGYNRESFAFNTGAAPELFDRQFDLFGKLVDLGIDLYAYVTLTTPDAAAVADDMRTFVDRLQAIAPNLPLRTVPLEIKAFTPAVGRLTDERRHSMNLQYQAIEGWQSEMTARFSERMRQQPVWSVPLIARTST